MAVEGATLRHLNKTTVNLKETEASAGVRLSVSNKLLNNWKPVLIPNFYISNLFEGKK